jgi:hypothetical protein
MGLTFSALAGCENVLRMDVRYSFKLVLALLVTAGLTIAPLATPAAAERSISTMMMQMADSSDVTADMPCCPDEQKNKTCQDCPLVATCMFNVLQTQPSLNAVVIRQSVRVRLHLPDDIVADGLARPPPDRPPRNLV